jgi:hypothetical protein
MKRYWVVLILSVMSMFLGRSMVGAQDAAHDMDTRGSSSTAADYLPETMWQIQVIDGDATTDVGQHLSLAVDKTNGRPFISYYDATHGDLRLAKHVGSGGNCGPNDTWYCETVDSGGNVGKYSAIDIYPGTGIMTWKLGISYYDVSNYALKYAQYAWTISGFKWTIETIETGSYSGGYGMYTSLEFDNGGVPNISYYHVSAPGDDALKYARREPNGSNCNASAMWTCETIDSGDAVGQYTSLGNLNTTNDLRKIAYYDGGNNRLMYARYRGSSGSGCNPANDRWDCYRVDSAGGEYASADKNAKGENRIAYYDNCFGNLMFATYVGVNGNCGEADTWNCTSVAETGFSSAPIGIAMLTKSSGSSLIAYRDVTTTSGPALRVARQYAVRVLGPAVYSRPVRGNIIQPPKWLFETVDNGGADMEVGWYVAVDQDGDSLVTIAYYEWDVSQGTGCLKVAWQRYVVYLPVLMKNYQ